MKKGRVLLCYDCGDRFAFPAKEREFYRRMHYQEPCHCRACRDTRRRERALHMRRIKRAHRRLEEAVRR